MRIPNRMTAALLIPAFLSLVTEPGITLLSRAMGGLAVSLPMYLMTLAVPESFGGGDIKLMAVCGLLPVSYTHLMVAEPTVEDTISILRGLKERYEVYHGVKITDSALVSAATLSDRYISDRFLPDKAIDLVDEACAMIKTELDSMPAELDELSRNCLLYTSRCV